MRPDEDISGTEGDAAACATALGGGADTSNRPWETDSLRIRAAGTVPRLGLLAITAAALLSLADMALLDAPAGGPGLGGNEALAAVPRWRLLVGHYLGVLLLPAYIPGYWLVFRGLRDAGPWRSWPVFVLGSYTAALAAVTHGLVALLAVIARHGAIDPPASRALLEQARSFVDPLHGLVNALFALTSLWLAVAVLSGRTRLPRWLALANPLALALLFVLPTLVAPGAAAARLAASASYNLGHLVFYCLVTAALGRDPAAGQLTLP